ncbi:nitroreductase family protein [Aquihabitans sp. G128]|uniref:nitroreductase family protein n=1 Tax=Aquihabitans sp. G128 TaxID=2849779 RepID=UPI001C24D2D4|nr:nitroreductase family protein [Aquihabitans sp. G128]QXC61670.1 nitroreductase family protein [Aquihabitans sp. G128]
MELVDAVHRRRMVRAFQDRPVDLDVVVGLCDLARRAPSAGNAQGSAFVVLAGPEQTARYWDLTLPEPRRSAFRWPGLVAAPVLVVLAVRPDAYVDRYAEPDKAATGLGEAADSWTVPYWWVDAGAAAEHLLLGAVDAGLGACLFGLFDHEPGVAAELGVPDGWRLVATIALGHPLPPEAAGAEAAGRSAGRPRRPLDEVVHLGGW